MTKGMNFIHTPGAINFTEIMKIHTPGALLINFIRIHNTLWCEFIKESLKLNFRKYKRMDVMLSHDNTHCFDFT